MCTRLLVIILILMFTSCEQKKAVDNKPDVLQANMDSTVNPGDDFFSYANGGWIKKMTIPETESSWSIGQMVQEEIYLKLKTINEDAAKNTNSTDAITKKIGSFWRSGMDSAGIDVQKLAPLQNEIRQITAIASKEDLTKVIAAMHTMRVPCAFGNYVGQDDKNSEEMAFLMGQGGLGMPNRDYYFNNDERTLNVKAAYKTYLLQTFTQLDSTTAAATADNVFVMETAMAKASRKLADLRDPYKNYNKMSWAQLEKLSPNFDWKYYRTTTGANKVDSVIIGQPEFFTAFNNLLQTTALATWKQYLIVRLIQANAAYLDSQTFNNFFAFRKSLTGATAPRARWKRVLDSEESAIGDALGQLFVKEYFSEKAKDRYVKMVEDVRDAYKTRISKLSWMSDSTKAQAYDKLAKIKPKVGYPDKWKDFSKMIIADVPWVTNVRNAEKWWYNYEINKLGKPVDRTEWGMTPQTYNAYYNPSNNEIVLPAGIFTIPGYRDEELDDAVVYGYAAASTIGHEITHGFDDQGRQYDASGNLKNWWSKKDEAEFTKRAAFIIKQFNEFSPVDTLHVNGDATQGENIADLGGVLLGFDAFKKTTAFKENKMIGGLTQTQRYFMGYALGWMSTSRKERLANQVMTDVHAPAKERVNGPVVNVPEFYTAFNIKPNAKMYRADSLRVNIW